MLNRQSVCYLGREELWDPNCLYIAIHIVNIMRLDASANLNNFGLFIQLEKLIFSFKTMCNRILIIWNSNDRVVKIISR